MSRKRLTAWVLALVLGVTARTTVAAPQTLVTQLRAVTCCADHCPKKPARPLTPNRCCFVGSPAADPASSGGTTMLERPASAPIATVSPSLPAVAGAVTDFRGELAAVRAGPPPYLRTHSLRL
ncbi:MAG TPA: hypothetical protein VMS22_06210 [Candidatus Eisenbacteria bacterium]|nr:hypothetical protein [Candidatus Eisenbacteria bacterium]